MVDCTTCGGELNIEKEAEINEIITCPDCGTELEITNLDPVTVQPAPQEEEDWGE